MIVDFQEWPNAYALSAQALTSSITSLCSAVRDLRTAAVRNSRLTQGDAGLANHNDVCNQLGELSIALATGVDELQETGSSASKRSHPRELTSKFTVIAAKIIHLQSVILELRTEHPALSMLDEKVVAAPAIRTPGLLQKGAKQFAALAEVFQLQDRFDQRHEHIVAGFSAALSVTDASRGAMFQVVNAQVDGVATMMTDYLQVADQSATALISMEATAAEKEAETSRRFYATLELIQSRVATLVGDLLDSCDRTVAESVATCENAASDELESLSSNIKKVSELAEILRLWHANIHSAPEGASLEAEKVALHDHLARVAERIDALSAGVVDLQSLSADQSGGFDSSASVGPEFSAVIADITGNFTMDSERDDHRAVMHRLGLTQHSG